MDHLILLNKLKYYGVTGAANLLFQNYLSNRQQYVEYNGATSHKLKISTGVPQGSILGPLLFLIYINDLPSVSNVLQMLMYADDTTLYCNFNSINNVNRINEELCKVSAGYQPTNWLLMSRKQNTLCFAQLTSAFNTLK